jgi:hypothetical protein
MLISRGRIARYGRDAAVGVVIWFLWYVVESLAARGLSAVGVTNVGAQGTVFPHGAGQTALWIVMAASSGFSEEITLVMLI